MGGEVHGRGGKDEDMGTGGGVDHEVGEAMNSWMLPSTQFGFEIVIEGRGVGEDSQGRAGIDTGTGTDTGGGVGLSVDGGVGLKVGGRTVGFCEGSVVGVTMACLSVST